MDPQINNIATPFTTHVNPLLPSNSTASTVFTPRTHFRPTSAAAAPNANFLGRESLVDFRSTGGTFPPQKWPPSHVQHDEIQRARSVQPSSSLYPQRHNVGFTSHPPNHYNHQNRDPRPINRHWPEEQITFTQNQNLPPPPCVMQPNDPVYRQSSHVQQGRPSNRSQTPSLQPSASHQQHRATTPVSQRFGFPQSTMVPPRPLQPQQPLATDAQRSNASATGPPSAPVRVQWQLPTVVDNVDAAAFRSFQPPPTIPMTSPKQPVPSLPFNPPSASLGRSIMNEANLQSSPPELFNLGTTLAPTPTQQPAAILSSESSQRKDRDSDSDSLRASSQMRRKTQQQKSKTPPPPSMGPSVQEHNQWSSNSPASSEPAPRPRMGKAEKALKVKVSDTDVVQAVTDMLDRHDEERRKVADELGISETRLRNLIGVHESYRAEKKPSAYNAGVHWKADQLNAGRAPNNRATLKEIHIALREDTEMMAALETWKRWKEERARRKAAKAGGNAQADSNANQQGVVDDEEEDDDSEDDDYDEDEEDEINDGGQGEVAEGSRRGLDKQARAQVAEVKRWFEALEVSKAEKFVGNRGSTKSVKKEGNVGANRLNRICENLAQKTGGLFWGIVCRSTYNTAIIPGMYGVAGPVDNYLMEKHGVSSYEFISSIESFVCEQALHGAKAMTVDKMRIWIRSKLERSLREATGDFNLTMQYKNYEVLIVEAYRVQLIGWPEHIPFNNARNMNNTFAKDLYNRLKSESIKWVKMRPQEYRRWKEDFDRRLESGETERPKRGERSDKGGTHKTGQTSSKKRGRGSDDQEGGSTKSKKSKKGSTSTTKPSPQPQQKTRRQASSAGRKSIHKVYKSPETINDSDDNNNHDTDQEENSNINRGPDDQSSGRAVEGDRVEGEMDEETRREIEADPDANDPDTNDPDVDDNASRFDILPL
ncbi:hypothetical protein PM082_011292 [Marasmius tenuissimus]|nr:hypothetical protein PM082_011292 [Marasmius tenuissimus]